jgi:hypothetical protein
LKGKYMPKQYSQNKPHKQGFVWLSKMARHSLLTLGFCLGVAVAPVASHAQTVKPVLHNGDLDAQRGDAHF